MLYALVYMKAFSAQYYKIDTWATGHSSVVSNFIKFDINLGVLYPCSIFFDLKKKIEKYKVIYRWTKNHYRFLPHDSVPYLMCLFVFAQYFVQNVNFLDFTITFF